MAVPSAKLRVSWASAPVERGKLAVDNEILEFTQPKKKISIEQPAVVPEVGEFLKKCLLVVVAALNAPEELGNFAEAFYRLLDGDLKSRKFYTKYGLDANKAGKDGLWAKKPVRILSCFLLRLFTCMFCFG